VHERLLLNSLRLREEYDTCRLPTAVHFESLSWDMVDDPRVMAYSVIVLYDEDGTAAANVLSVMFRAFRALKAKRGEDVFCVLGGASAVLRRFPHLAAAPAAASGRALIPWMPTLVPKAATVPAGVYLGRHEQAESGPVIASLGITHILSIGRYIEHTP